MDWPAIRVLQGPNVWASCPMLEVELDLAGIDDDASRLTRAMGRLHAALPGPDAAASDLPLTLARSFGQVALALQSKAGSPVKAEGLERVRPGVFRVAVEFEEEALGRAGLEASRRLCLEALGEGVVEVERELAALRSLAHEIRLGPSTSAIVAAARRQGIPAFRLNDGNLIELGHGVRRRRIWTAETDRTGAIAEFIAQDKDLTRALLRGVGVPVPEGRPATSADDAWDAAVEIGPPVVVKPRFGNHGRGVATNLSTPEQVGRAFAAAREHGDEIVVERYIPGQDYRLLVVGGQLVAASLREPPTVTGDGISTVTELVAAVNLDPRRSDGHSTSLSFVKLDAIACGVLAEQGLAPECVPGKGQRVIIRRNANLSSGGTATDVTDEVHPRAAASAVAAARAVGLDIAGVDVVSPGIDQPLEQSGGAVVEVNAGPGLRMHLEPSAGKPRPVGDAVIRMLFPAGTLSRIPLAVVAGGNTGATASLLARILAGAGHLVGLASAGGLQVGDRRIEEGDSRSPRGLRRLLLNPRVTAAVLETSSERIAEEGLGADQCAVAVVSKVGSTAEASLLTKTAVQAVPPAGTVVLDADDPHAAAMGASCTGSVLFLARTEGEAVAAHLARDGRAMLVRQDQLVLVRGEVEEVLLPLGDLKGCGADSALGAAGAAWAMGIPVEKIRAGLTAG